MKTFAASLGSRLTTPEAGVASAISGCCEAWATYERSSPRGSTMFRCANRSGYASKLARQCRLFTGINPILCMKAERSQDTREEINHARRK